MRKDIQINVNSETNQIVASNDTLGITSENLQGKIIFKPQPFVDGACRLYIEGKGSILMDKQEDCYTLDILSSLLEDSSIDICFKITEPENEKGIPKFVSKIMHFRILDTIESDEEIPDQYPSWIDVFDSKIAEINALEQSVEEAEQDRYEAEVERNKKVDDAVANIKDLTDEYNQNAIEKTNDFNANSTNKTNDFNENATEKTNNFNNNADERKEEIETIADGVKDMATAIQFATFEVNNDMDLIINTAEKLANTSFDFNENTGELEVEIING